MRMRLAALLTFAIGFVVPTFAQQAKDLVGTWTLVSLTFEQDGKKTDFYGPNPRGQLTYDADGHFSEILTRSDLPKFASNSRMTGTAEENKSIVQGILAQFGTYSVSEADKMITRHIESCTFPNYNGMDRKSSFSVSGDELSITGLSGTSTGTGTPHLIWKRAQGSGGDPAPTASPSNQLPPFDGAS
jgi:hypothetical protein